MKKKLAIGGVVLAAVALLAIGTLAYFVSEARATNTITTGTVEIKLNEYSVYHPESNPESPVPGDAAGQTGNVPYSNPGALLPGEAVDKIPVITNTGTADCWVRMRVSLDFAPGTAIDSASSLAEMVLPNYDQENWVEQGGLYYYMHPLAPGESAPPLFRKVALSEEMGNAFQGAAFVIDLEAEAVQSKNNPLAGDNYAALWLDS